MHLLLLLACIQRLDVPPPVSLGPVGETLLIQDVAVFPATGPDLVLHQDVQVENGRISAITPTGASPPEAAILVPGAGRTLLPGLIDAHVHLSGAPGLPWATVAPDPALNLASWLYAGVTTVYDMGGSAPQLERLAAAVERGEIPGPRIVHTAGPVTVPGGHPVGMIRALAPWPVSALFIAGIPIVHGPSDAEAVVSSILAEPGAAFLKVVRDRDLPDEPEMDDDTLRALVTAAHAQRKKVAVHIGDEGDALAAVQAGADVLAHMVYRGAISEQAAQEIAQAQVPVITTWSAFEHIHQTTTGTRAPTAWDRALLPADFLERATADSKRKVAEVPALGKLLDELEPSAALWQSNIAALQRAGVTLLVGTDAVLPGHFPGGSFHEELGLLHRAGIPNTEILLGATVRSARLWGPVDHGTVEVGSVADLLLVEGDPTQDLAALAHIAAVIKGGRRVLRRSPAP